jgi:hypothetical protein
MAFFFVIVTVFVTVTKMELSLAARQVVEFLDHQPSEGVAPIA